MTSRQITDPRAPFATIEDAHKAGHEHLRGLGWHFVAMVAEEQPGGYFVRIVGSTPVESRGGRANRKRRHQQHTAEVGKISGPAHQPINDTWLSGRPYYCNACGLGGAEVMACEDFGCEIETVGQAQARLVAAHQRGEGMPQP